MKSSIKRLFVAFIACVAVMAAAAIGASACSAFYTGADVMKEGTPFVARTEDYGSDMNKMFFVMDQGTYKEGETYVGCPAYGAFEWTWTHDSYRFTYFNNDFYEGVCPECGETCHNLSYTEFGTNEKGVSVSATETISGNSAVTSADPFCEGEDGVPAGIEETDIPTIILAEAATAREGLELLMDIYDELGAVYSNGLFICDQNEVWYIENCSGTTYLAVKLNDDMIFFEPNMAIIGQIDLDDTENVIASDNLIAVAKEAGTFVGNEEENIIDFRASYANGLDRMDQRMIDGLNFINKDYNYTAEKLIADNSLFEISNVKDGEIVQLYTNIEADRVLDKNDVFGYYKLSSVGKPSNQEIEIFQLFKDEPVETGTVGWVGIGNMSSNVFVPYYPLLLENDIYEGCQKSLPTTERVENKPGKDKFFTYSVSRWYPAPWVVFPEGWEDSYYFTFEGLGDLIAKADYITGAPVTAADKQYVLDRLYSLQQEFNEEFAAMDPEDTTAAGKDMSERAHKLGLELIAYLQNAPIERFCSDVKYTDWYHDYVLYTYDKGIMNGMSASKFGPDVVTTREMFVTMLYRLEGQPAFMNDNVFTDVPDGKYFTDAVIWANGKDIVKGMKADVFGVGSPVTREQVATMLYRYAQYKEMDVTLGEETNILSYDDVDQIHSYAMTAMQWASGTGIIQGDNGKLKPRDGATRAQIATMFARFCDLTSDNPIFLHH